MKKVIIALVALSFLASATPALASEDTMANQLASWISGWSWGKSSKSAATTTETKSEEIAKEETSGCVK